MAAPATHIILAKLIKEKYFPTIEDKEYYLGTSFADIRYIANIDRNLTHFYNINSPTDIVEKTAFMIGLKVHSYVDEKRADFMKHNGLFDYIPNEKLPNQVMKAYEDILLYDEITGWENFSHFFDEIIPEEKKFPISEDKIKQWHKTIQCCINKKPDEELVVSFLGSKLQQVNEQEIRDILQILKANEKINILIKNFYQNFQLTL